jgi:peptidoglycan/LPS O-acetylase OafA/YrhL
MRLAKFGPASQSLRSYAILAGLAALMLPNFGNLPLTRAVAYPLDFPAWSLIIEIFANVFHGIALRRRSDRFLAGVVVVAGLLMLASLKLSGTVDVGSSAKYLGLAIPRILFSYTLGMLLFRVWKRGKLRFRIPFLLSPVLLVFLLMTPWCGGHVIRYDLLVIFLLFPLLLLASASSNPPARLTTVSLLLGRTSYAIYVLHFPLRELQFMALHHLARHTISLSPLETQIVLLLVAITIALLVDRFYDDPVRAFLRRRFIAIKRIKAIPPTPISM